MTETKLKIRLYGDPCLRKKSEEVQSVGPGERLLINSMIATMHHAKGIGLAAPQVGINKQIFVADVGDGPMVFINPRITKQEGSHLQEEGCLSIPEVTIEVKRPKKITVEFLNEHNEMYEIKCDGILARVIQHENDHLLGKLILDYADHKVLEDIQEQLAELEKLSRE